MITAATPLDSVTGTTDSIHTALPPCQWCRKYPAEISASDGAWCCELHQEADRAGKPRPVWREVPANAIHDGYGGCVWCGNPLCSPDCPHPISIGGTPR